MTDTQLPTSPPAIDTLGTSQRSGGDGMKVQQHAAPLRKEVARLLRTDILDGILAPGQRLIEGVLCERYGVSRTVIREALRQLESESLISVLPNKGPIVTVLTSKDIAAIYEVRRCLEGLAGELFAAWLAVRPGVADGTVLTPSANL